MTVRKKLFFSCLVTVTFFGLLELLLLAVGVRPAHHEKDPYIGFASYSPVFVEREETGADRMVTASNKLDWFNRQRFPAEKPSATYRVFGVGGSTTYGRPYDDATSYCGWLRELLPAADDSRHWEVINAGGISYASYRVVKVMEELVRYEPDLFVVYSGHNEFLERCTYGDLRETPEPILGLGALLNRTRTFTALRRLTAPQDDRRSRASDTDELPAEVFTRLDQSIGPEDYSREHNQRPRTIAHYRSNLRRMVRIARSAGARILLVVPASNLRDCRPFKSQHRTNLTPAEKTRWEEAVAQARAALENDDFKTGLDALNRALELDGRFAETHFLRGRALWALERHEKAKAAYRRARDEDVCPLRATTRMQQIVRRVAAEHDVPVVDFARLTARRSERGVPGQKLFLDHVHPTIDGHRMLARALLKKMQSLGIVAPASAWSEDAIQRVGKRIKSRLDPQARATALRNLSKVLAWAGKTEEADRLALRAIELLPDDAEAHYQAGNACVRQGDLATAAEHYRQGLQAAPNSARNHYGLGLVLDRRGEPDKAMARYRRALRLDSDMPAAHYNLARLYEARGSLNRAEQHYREVLRLNPHDADAHTALGVLLARRGRIDRAASRFRRALQADANHPNAHANLGRVFVHRNQPAQAISHFRAALETSPDHLMAANNLAWLLATAEPRSLRDGGEAVRWAERCAKATDYENTGILRTLAAAHFEAGQYKRAVHWQSRAVELADPSAKDAYGRRLKKYESRARDESAR